MKRFIKNILLFFVPVVVFFCSLLPFYLWAEKTGEFEAVIVNAERQRNEAGSLLGMGYNEQTPVYKLLNANHYRRQIIALGTSRVMQFEEEFFNKDVFYNCGGGANGNYDEYLNFMKNLKYKPEVIILGLDSWVFNDAWNKNLPVYDYFQELRETQSDPLRLLVPIIRDWFQGKWTVVSLDAYPNNIGFNGRVKDKGFRLDGSHYYGDHYRHPELQQDYKFVNTLHRIETGTMRFEWGEHIDSETVRLLDDLLKYCKEQGIFVIGFIPPFAPSIYKTMVNSGNYGYLAEIAQACQEIFQHYGFDFFDYQDGAVLGFPDDYYVDGFHGSEVVYGQMVKDMAGGKSTILAQYADTEQLERLLKHPYSGLVFVNPDERL